MNYEVIYEVPKQVFPFETIFLSVMSIAVVYCVIESLIIHYKEKAWTLMYFITVLIGIIIAIVLLCCGINEYKNTGGDYTGQYVKKYYAGNYLEVEGTIQNYEFYKGTEMFTVDGISFNYRTTDSFNGFNDPSDRINKNGDIVRIRYINDDNLIRIMRVEVKVD